MKDTVMVVDDDPSVQKMVRAYLESEGLKVIAVENGEACIREASKGFEGLILMDIKMTGMDGWDTIQMLIDKGIVKGNLICMMTADLPDDRMKIYKEYVLDYVKKPFDIQKLVKLVKDYLSYL
jgi:DNA-binding response OmpR family regulator